MKRIVMAMAGVLTIAATCGAAVKVIGRGETRAFDSAGFPPVMRSNYEIMKVRCVRCHTLERVVEAITTGISPISGQPFDRNAVKAYGAKMLRKTNSGMNKHEVAATVELMNYLLDQSR